MATAKQTAGADKGQPAEASHKRNREISDAEKVVERKYGLDVDILDCPICLEPFSPPVYQCTNGHTACSACCKKLVNKRCPSCTLPTGSIRCIAIEKMLESLLVMCKYAPHGCKQMLKQADIEKHEKLWCAYEPYLCPVPECNYEGSRVTLPVHLADDHYVQRVALNRISGVGFIMESSVRFMMVESDEEDDLLFLVHRQVHEPLGNVFFCSSLGVSCISYNLKVVLCSYNTLSYSMTEALSVNLKHMKEECWNRDFLLLPFYRSGAKRKCLDVEVLFSLPRED